MWGGGERQSIIVFLEVRKNFEGSVHQKVLYVSKSCHKNLACTHSLKKFKHFNLNPPSISTFPHHIQTNSILQKRSKYFKMCAIVFQTCARYKYNKDVNLNLPNWPQKFLMNLLISNSFECKNYESIIWTKLS